MRQMLLAAGWALCGAVFVGGQPLVGGEEANPKVFTDPALPGPNFAAQREYVGKVEW